MRNGELVIFPVTEPGDLFSGITASRLERKFGERRRTRGRSTPARVDSDSNLSPPDDRVALSLYVSHDSASCARAVVALQQIIRIFPAEAFQVRIIDVASDVDAAARDAVLFTPTLMMLDRGGRATRMLGDLSNVNVLVDLLRGAGLEPV